MQSMVVVTAPLATPPKQLPRPEQSTLHVDPSHLTPLLQESSPSQTITPSCPWVVTAPKQLPSPEQSILQDAVPHWTAPWHDFSPSHRTSQLTAEPQSTPPKQLSSPHSMRHTVPAGQVVFAWLHESGSVQSTTQTPALSQTPAFPQSCWHSGSTTPVPA